MPKNKEPEIVTVSFTPPVAAGVMDLGARKFVEMRVSVDWDQLEEYCGTEAYHRVSSSDVVLSDGIYYLAQHGLARLVKLILEQQQIEPTLRKQYHQVWRVLPDGSTAGVSCRPAQIDEEHVPELLYQGSVPIELERPVELWIIDRVLFLPREY